ncbi:MAG: ATP-binding protein [Candidatus Limnocylindrales bacterium]
MTAERDGGAAQASSPSGSGPASVRTPGSAYGQALDPAIDPAIDPAVDPAIDPAVDPAVVRATVGIAPGPDEQASRPPFHDRTIPSPSIGAGIGFRTRLTFALIAAAVIPLAVFGLLLIAALRLPDPISTVPRLLLLFVVLVALIAVLVAYLLAADLTAPLRAIAAAVDRVSAGDLSTPISVGGDDELSRLAESHNRLAGALERRNRELGRILSAVEHASPRDGVEFLVGRASADARAAFGMIDSTILLVDPTTIPGEEIIPGDPLPIRAELRAGDERLGLIVGHLPATRAWEPADQNLLELFAAEIGVAVRNAQLFQRVADQNSRLVELDAAKDDFLRGVSHNLQTPLTSIRAFAEQLGDERADRRLAIITEQSERLSRMVRQLLTVTRLESGALRPQAEVLGLGTRVRRAWEALAVADVAFSIDDRSAGWLAVADADQLDQVLWALLDNAVKYGRHQPIEVEIALRDTLGRISLTIIDHGPGVAEPDRAHLFERFARGRDTNAEDGSGLGLYVSRELCRAMNGDLVVEPLRPGRGAAFTLTLPGEAPLES